VSPDIKGEHTTDLLARRLWLDVVTLEKRVRITPLQLELFQAFLDDGSFDRHRGCRGEEPEKENSEEKIEDLLRHPDRREVLRKGFVSGAPGG
jgi:hypothetical protein